MDVKYLLELEWEWKKFLWPFLFLYEGVRDLMSVRAVLITYGTLFRFPVDDNSTMKSVVEYFQEMYGFTIQHAHLPCLQVGNQRKANYLPMEVRRCHWKFITLSSQLILFFLQKLVWNLDSLLCQACKIVEGQRYTKRLNERQITALLKVTCQRPRDRENDILQVPCFMSHSCMYVQLPHSVFLQTLPYRIYITLVCL